MVWLPAGRTASTSTNADALTGFPNTYPEGPEELTISKDRPPQDGYIRLTRLAVMILAHAAAELHTLLATARALRTRKPSTSEAPPQTIEVRGSAGVRARGGSSWQP